jgi:molybdopterin molybdotransferase
MLCSQLFLKPAMFKLAGDDGLPHRFGRLPLAVPLSANDQRQDYLRARSMNGRAVPHPTQDSGELSPLANSDILIVRPPFDPAKALGDPVDIMFLENA